MKVSLRRVIPLALGVCVALGLALWLSRNVDILELRRLIGAVPLWLIVLLALMPMLSAVLRGVRLHLLLQHRTDYLTCLHATNVGNMINCLLPFRSGEICICVLLGAQLPGGQVEAFSRIFIDRVFDICAVLMLFMVALSTVNTHFIQSIGLSSSIWALVAVLVSIIAIVLAICVFRAHLFRLLVGITRVFPGTSAAWSMGPRAALQNLHTLFTGRVLLAAFAVSLAVWAIAVLTFHISVAALVAPLPIASSIIVICLIVFGLMVAPMPAGISTTHGAIVLTLGAFGVPPASALSVALLYHTLSTAMLILLGWTSLWAMGVSLRRLLAGACAVRGRRMP